MSTEDRGGTRTDRLVALGTAATGTVVLAGSAAQLIGYGVFGGTVPALDSSADGGVFGIVGDLALAGAAVAVWTVLLRTRPAGPVTAALPPLLTFLALDKAVRLHDHVSSWIIIYLPLLGFTLVAAVVAARRLSTRCSRLVAIALTLLSASFLLHQFGEDALSLVTAPYTGWAHQLKAVVKHGAEVAGWLTFALGFVVGLRDRVEADHHPIQV